MKEADTRHGGVFRSRSSSARTSPPISTT